MKISRLGPALLTLATIVGGSGLLQASTFNSTQSQPDAYHSRLLILGDRAWAGGPGRNLTIERGAHDMSYVHDRPYTLPYIASVVAGEALYIDYIRTAKDHGFADDKITNVRLFWQIEDSGIVEIDMEWLSNRGGFSKSVDIPTSATGEIALWFKVELQSGSKLWDSQYGKNYNLNIIPANCAHLRFLAPVDGNWVTPKPDRQLIAGHSVCLHYERDRIKALGVPAGWYRMGIVEPTVQGWLRFSDEAGKEIGQYALGNELKDARFEIPVGAREMQLWFKGQNYYAGVAEKWDNNFGRDFRFGVEADQ